MCVGAREGMDEVDGRDTTDRSKEEKSVVEIDFGFERDSRNWKEGSCVLPTVALSLRLENPRKVPVLAVGEKWEGATCRQQIPQRPRQAWGNAGNSRMKTKPEARRDKKENT
ncbi:uncharacterized protein SPSK_05665 [Sporothrix schenckii 1099-18]|uniref:Uncharacterized protein n=1 Tax=Sporothrix schenckii 1099-18 TaxID=1397361 RepID=A0A0F2LVY4_SPOSC|nr:uncharacterized protein SPSK_05665 [Sporothrix schenckii 1099-18]KJR80989.1 hypothetical protein SPSK_05665 [Sporothrix schenckii 1099-18]